MKSELRFGENVRARFDQIYETCIIGSGFGESDDYYRLERERYWRSLNLLCRLGLPTPARLLEIGGGQLAVLFKGLFNDDCTVADISEVCAPPLHRQGVKFFKYNLTEALGVERELRYDVVVLLEVIEHVPLPAYVILERIKPFLGSAGILFLTTPNLFRIRNLVRMFLGVEFLDRFQLPGPGQGLGHQLEYSADHLRWHLHRANMEIIMLQHDELGHIGHSVKARLGRSLTAPLRLRPMWRDGLVVAARKVSGC
jgi:hypothetical protein